MDAIGAIRSQQIKQTDPVAPVRAPEPSPSRDRAVSQNGPPSKASGPDFNQIVKNTQEKMQRVAQVMEDYVRSTQTSLRIQVYPGTGDFSVKVISEEDGRTIREIPPEEMLNLAAKMEEMIGLLFNEEV